MSVCVFVKSIAEFSKNFILTKIFIFCYTYMQIKDMYFAIYSDSSKNCARVGRPSDVTNLRVEIKQK